MKESSLYKNSLSPSVSLENTKSRNVRIRSQPRYFRRADRRLFSNAPLLDPNPRRLDVDAGSIASSDVLEVEHALAPFEERCALSTPE